MQLEKSIQEAENVKKEAESKINAAKKELGLPIDPAPSADATPKAGGGKT